jgi:hypothetical protein
MKMDFERIKAVIDETLAYWHQPFSTKAEARVAIARLRRHDIFTAREAATLISADRCVRRALRLERYNDMQRYGTDVEYSYD